MRDTSHRREHIARMLKENGSVQVLPLIEQFNVSGVTIRKDLRFLENQGIATRCYGGAMLNDIGLFETETTFDRKQALHAEEKSSIGKIAADLVNDGDAIILDSGSTTLKLASHLGGRENVTVVTNSLNIVNELKLQEHIEVMLLGGTLRHKSQSFFGSSALATLKDLHVDKLFLGVDGFHMDKGISTHFEAESLLNQLMCKVASEIIVVTDSSKFGHVCLHKILEPTGVNQIITDSNIPQDYLDGLRRIGIKITLVDVD
ncbi:MULTISPECIES: transcriptional repressor AgaR [Alteromonadaceae]|uniref:transcriptional repressor AgaR n=1 Tax=Alteromonadaceae TaxID=72275 RepID=UPI001C0836BC|nr:MULTISPECIES: transcriptional repressor AgaR [Aliiglaciecola]MBU2878917.1 DeoR family transcriptional regulator [Aliiglaciecola lipolytica]MDO6712936.1 transcriptional repressor AgaR [Aliiglaciecola sp. 2_MG-2023]MDO6753975.1 transcriptional repressor AgaR [Aliiglaciecola sp. 1_MG-2023]